MRTPPKVIACLAGLAALGASVGTPAPAALGARAPAVHRSTAGAPAALRRSLNLWATIDVCNPADQPDYVGVRGSMPGDKLATDEIYMRFRLQVTGAPGKGWVDLPGGSSPGFIRVSSALKARQGGWSFRLTPRGGSAVTLRGVVTFEWRRGATVLAQLSRPTTAAHESLAGADPAGYSAATCSIG
jgi:hypothetical protein